MEFRYESKKPRNLFTSLLVNVLSISAAAYLLPGVRVDSIVTAILVAIVLALLNATVKPLLILLTLPLTLVTLGLFLLVVNAIVILIAAHWIDGFSVDSLGWATGLSLLISFINSVLFNAGERSK